MSDYPSKLPGFTFREPEYAGDEKLLGDVRDHGWHVVGVLMNSILLVSVSVLTVGCYPLPSPTYSVSQYGVDATLVDESSGEPVSGRRVTLVIEKSRMERLTARNGKVSAAASKHRYWTWLGGPIWASASSATIVIEPEGYTPERIEWSAWDKSHAPLEDGRIQAGRVAMTRR